MKIFFLMLILILEEQKNRISLCIPYCGSLVRSTTTKKFRPTKRNETKNPWLCVCFLCKHVRKHIFTEWGNYKKKEKFKFQFMKYNNEKKFQSNTNTNTHTMQLDEYLYQRILKIQTKSFSIPVWDFSYFLTQTLQ